MGEKPDTVPGIAPGTEVLGRYRLLRRIARGGMGTVWEAFDTRLHQRVALKHVRFGEFGPEHADDTRLRTLREARTAAQLRGQPHVVDVFDVQEQDGDVWLVLEFVPSRSLAQILDDGPLAPEHAARIGAEIARALHAAHARRVLHRDVKPANVLIADADGGALLTDFGISHIEDDPRITAADVVTGTPAYMAPEVARGEASTAASDVFCLGATLYACVEGRAPFGPADNPRQALYKAAGGEVTEPRQAGPLTGVLAQMLHADPAARPDAATAADLLGAVAGGTGAFAARPDTDGPVTPPPPPAPARRARRRRVATVLGAVAALVVGGGAATVALTGSGVPGPDPAPPAAGAYPAVAGPRAVTGDPRDVDACRLIDATALKAFGAARLDTRTAPDSCRARLPGTAQSGPFDLFVRFVVSTDIDGRTTSQQIGSLKVRTGPRYTNGNGHEACKSYVVLSDGTAVESLVLGAVAPATDPCPLSVASTRAIATIVDRAGVPSDPARNAGFSMKATDACTLVPAADVTATVGTGAVPVPGYARWSCRWKGSTGSMTLVLTGGTADVGAWGTSLPGTAHPTATQGRRAQCTSTVQHKAARPADRTEFVQVTVDRKGAAPIVLCPVSTALATAAEGRAPA